MGYAHYIDYTMQMKLWSHTYFLPSITMLRMITSTIIFRSKLKTECPPRALSLILAHYMCLAIKRGPNSNVHALVFR